MDTIGITLEVIGAILVSTSYIGPERLRRWENTIRAYLHAQQPIALLAHRLEPTILICFRVLMWPTIIILAFWGLLIIQSFLGYIRQTVARGQPLWVSGLTNLAISLLIGFSIFPFILIAKNVGSTLSLALSYLLYGTVFLLCIAGYSIILILLIPYSATDRIVIRFGLTTTLGVLGALCTLVGVSLQLSPFRNFLRSLNVFG
jgi:cytochrome bd-type quinol oxidase subunit 2